MNLLSESKSNAKTIKSLKRGIDTTIMYLAPADTVEGVNVCPNATPGCKIGCLYYAGRAQMFKSIPKARIARTELWKKDKRAFMDKLVEELGKFKGDAVRLNGTSDIDFMQWAVKYYGKPLYEMFPNVRFYDYTKVPSRMFKYIGTPYYMTFSRSEVNEKWCHAVLAAGGNVAVVFRKKLPDQYWGYEVIDGDKDDVRFLDDQGVIVGLKAKGQARTDETGFVV